MIPFELAEPTSLAAAIKLLDPDDETVRPIAGGTALMLMMKAGVFRPAKLVSLRKIERQYTTITAGADGLTIGAMTTLGTLERSAGRPQACAAHHAHLPHALQCPRAQCRHRRRRHGARRSAHGSAAGADGARRLGHRRRARRRAQPCGRGFVFRLLRDRTGEERADHLGQGAGAGRQARGLYEGDDRLGRRLAGARRCGRASRARATPSSRRASSPAPRPKRPRGSHWPKRP